jgi:hypothetical protein
MMQLSYKEQLALAKSQQTSSEALDELAEITEDFFIRYLIMKHPNVSLKVLNKMVDKIVDLPTIERSCACARFIETRPRATEELILKCRSQLLKFELKI